MISSFTTGVWKAMPNILRGLRVQHVLRNHWLFANKNMYSCGKKQLAYLGHIVSKQGVPSNPNNWNGPQNVKNLRGEAGVMMAEVGSGESKGEKIPQAVYENKCSTLFNSDRLV
jgi:hypothetical protein